MEHLLFYLVLYIRSLDERWLRPLRFWIPDAAEIMNDPAHTLQDREIEIGPWTRHVKIWFLPSVLFLPLLGLSRAFDSLLVTIILSSAWLVLAQVLMASGRGGTCILPSSRC